MNRVTYERVHELLDYDPDTGVFRWRVTKSGVRAGKRAGYNHPDGYRYIRVDRVSYQEHRIVWLYIHGYFPENDVDHIDRVRDNNRADNLREVSRQCNLRNSKTSCANTSGVCGVHWEKRLRKWGARIAVNGKNKRLGIYDDYEDAVCARLAAEQCIGWSECDSNSGAYRYIYDPLQI